MLTVNGIQKEKQMLINLTVQKRATKLIPELAKKPYGERLRILNLPTLKYRQYRGDIIELFKWLNLYMTRYVYLVWNLGNCCKGGRTRKAADPILDLSRQVDMATTSPVRWWPPDASLFLHTITIRWVSTGVFRRLITRLTCLVAFFGMIHDLVKSF